MFCLGHLTLAVYVMYAAIESIFKTTLQGWYFKSFHCSGLISFGAFNQLTERRCYPMRSQPLEVAAPLAQNFKIQVTGVTKYHHKNKNSIQMKVQMKPVEPADIVQSDVHIRSGAAQVHAMKPPNTASCLVWWDIIIICLGFIHFTRTRPKFLKCFTCSKNVLKNCLFYTFLEF